MMQEDCHALIQGALRHPNGFVVQRDQALLATFLATGARVSELICADLPDLDLKGKRIRLHRKGGDVQSLPLSEDALSFLHPYMGGRRRRAHCRAVFVSVRGHRLTRQSVRAIVDRCAGQARLPRSRLSPHTLRHTFATMLLANGENLETIRVLMNHKRLATTARYLHTQDEKLHAAVNRITLSGR